MQPKVQAEMSLTSLLNIIKIRVFVLLYWITEKDIWNSDGEDNVTMRIMCLTSLSYLFNLKVHLHLSLKIDPGEDQPSQTK